MQCLSVVLFSFCDVGFYFHLETCFCPFYFLLWIYFFSFDLYYFLRCLKRSKMKKMIDLDLFCLCDSSSQNSTCCCQREEEVEVVACSRKHLVLLNAKMWTKHLQSIPAEQEVVLSCRQRRTTQHVPQISKSLPVSEQYLNIRALVFFEVSITQDVRE